MDEQTIISTLTENGGKLWEKAGMRRVYFAPETAMSLDISKYGSGNISSAACAGSRISNSEAYRALNVKVWYDVTTGQFSVKNLDALHGACREALTAFIARMTALLS